MLGAGGENYLTVFHFTGEIRPPSRVKLGKHIVKQKYRLLAAVPAGYCPLSQLKLERERALLPL